MRAVRTCAGDGCDQLVPRPPGRRGRPPIYCSPDCRPSRRPLTDPLTVEVEPDDADDGGRGREWMVRLRRGGHIVVVHRGLGRLSADTVAHELRWFLGLSQQKGGATD